MIDLIISFLIQQHFILLYLIPLVLIVKIVLFTKNRSRSWKFANFFYFDAGHIISSRSNYIESAKKIQNTLSLIVVVLAVIQIGLFLLIAQ